MSDAPRWVPGADYAAALEQSRQEFDCAHPTVELRWKNTGAGRRWWQQCLTCGAKKRTVRNADTTAAQRAASVEYDDALAERWWKRRQARYQELREQAETRQQEADTARSDEWNAWYAPWE